MKRKLPQLKRYNPVAKSLRTPANQPKTVRPRKGKGAYSRKGKPDHV